MKTVFCAVFFLLTSTSFATQANEAHTNEEATQSETKMNTNQSSEPKTLQFTPARPYGEIREVFKDIFFVTGTNKIQFKDSNIQTSRNMVIVRNGSELTLINTVRLSEEALRKLNTLGNVKNIIRIGAFHGRDDAFYKSYYPESQLWVLKGMTYDSGLKADQEITPDGKMPLPNCSLFTFKTSTLPEGILHINQDGGILISCDSIQNITSTDKFYNAETAQSFKNQGLVKTANITSIWLGATKTTNADFKRLLETLQFKHLITAHGEPLMNTAHEEVTKTIKRVFE